MSVKRKNDKQDGQRKHCGCVPSTDVWRYGTCFHGCTYCFARKEMMQNFMLEEAAWQVYERKTGLEFDYF